MRIGCRISVLLVLLASLLPTAQAEVSIFMPAMVPTPVLHSAHRKSASKPVPLQWPKTEERK